MNEISFLQYLPWILGGFAIGLFIILYRDINYPNGDALALFSLASSLKRFNRIDQFFVVSFPDNPTFYNFKRNNLFYSYNLFINLIRMLPESGRLRAAQWMNIGFFLTLLSLSLCFFTLTHPSSLAFGLLFTLFIAINVKLATTAMVVCTDILGYVLFMLSCLSVVGIMAEPSATMYLILGATTGMSFRNRQSDIILFIAASTTLIITMTSPILIGITLAGFLITIGDLLFYQFVKGERALDGILGFMKTNLPKTDSPNVPKFQHLVSQASQGFRQMLAWNSKRSLWHSVGIPLALLPVSLIYLGVAGLFTESIAYLLICYLGYTCAFLLLREENDADLGYFGHRAAYILIVITHLINGVAFMGLAASNLLWVEYAYLGIYTWYFFKQAVWLWQTITTDKVHIDGLISHQKKPEPYTVDLRKWLDARKEPTVVMGSHPTWGEIYGYYIWTDSIRAVNLETKLDDASLLQIADHYKVTHIALTPMSWYPIPGKTTVRSAELSPLLKERLIPHRISEDLTIFEVIPPRDVR